jgi:sugar/nucleoside kinase (ribokinase family)
VTAGPSPLNTNGAGEAYLAAFLRSLIMTGSTEEAGLAARDCAHRYLAAGVCGEFPRYLHAALPPGEAHVVGSR